MTDDGRQVTPDPFHEAVNMTGLRLLTCGRRFDEKTGYSANVVVFAHLTSLKKAA